MNTGNRAKAIIEPSEIIRKHSDFPKVGVSCFSLSLIKKTAEKYGGTKIASLVASTGRVPIYKIPYSHADGSVTEIALITAAVGAPACVMEFEECIAMGLERLVQFGSCGRLVSGSRRGSLIVPTAAICDEGTSRHYSIVEDVIEINTIIRDRIKNIFERNKVQYIEGKTWTTDGVYRETREKADNAVSRGAVCVEMECSAMLAAADFRGVEFYPFFFSADDLSEIKWNPDGLGDPTLHNNERIMSLALEIAAEL